MTAAAQAAVKHVGRSLGLLMRPLSDLVVEDDPAWPEIEASIARAPRLGSVVFHTGGILIDRGWLRVLGSGHRDRSLLDIQAANDGEVFGIVVGQDVLGGIFAWGTTLDGATPTIHYFAPDSLRWEDLGSGYSARLNAMLDGATAEFYESLRWPGWEAEVASCQLDFGIHTLPPAWTAQGKDLSRVSRKPVPMREIVSINVEFARQFDGPSD